MRTLYSGTVFYSDKQRQPEPFYEPEEFDSVEEFVDTVTTLLADEYINPEAEKLAVKLNNRDYEVELSCDGEVNYVYVNVHM